MAVLLLALATLPFVWLRSEPWLIPVITPEIIPATTRLPATVGDFTRVGLWQLDSPTMAFGGYSAMLALGDRWLRLFSDRGGMLTITVPGTQPDPADQVEIPFASVWNVGPFSQQYRDIESATRDPQTLDYWLGFENFNAIARYGVASNFIAARQPPEMQDWPINGGAEAMVRLADGRFIVLPEDRRPGLLFFGDPTREVRSQSFAFHLPDPYFATDMAALPDGRVVILARGLEWGLSPFTARLYLADPADIGADTVWTPQLVAELDALLPRENYEALAVVPQDGGDVLVWIASDDNLAALQRTLLAQLRWRLPPLPAAVPEPEA